MSAYHLDRARTHREIHRPAASSATSRPCPLLRLAGSPHRSRSHRLGTIASPRRNGLALSLAGNVTNAYIAEARQAPPTTGTRDAEELSRHVRSRARPSSDSTHPDPQARQPAALGQAARRWLDPRRRACIDDREHSAERCDQPDIACRSQKLLARLTRASEPIWAATAGDGRLQRSRQPSSPASPVQPIRHLLAAWWPAAAGCRY